MVISKVTVNQVAPNGKQVAVASVTFNGELTVHGFRVCRGDEGLYVLFPHRGKWRMVEAESGTLRNEVAIAVLEAVKQKGAS